MKRFLSTKKGKKYTSLALVVLFYVLIMVLSSLGLLKRQIISLLVPVCAFAIAAVGLNFNVGNSGELNLGQAGFMSLGGFCAVIVAAYLRQFINIDLVVLVVAILVGSFMAGFVAYLISIPVLKLEGDYLAIVTLAFGQIIMSLLNNLYVGLDKAGLHFSFVNNTLHMQEGGRLIISGPMGTTGVKMISSFGAGIVLLMVALVLVHHILDSRFGLAIEACRDNRIAASTVGMKVSKVKTLAFVVSGALGGAGGALYLLNYSSMAATNFDFNTSILILVYVVLGGLANMSGTLIATVVLVLLPEMLRFLSGYRMLIYAIVLIVIMIVSNNTTMRVFLARLKRRKEKAI